MKRSIVINYDRAQISLGEAATTEDVTAWLDNLAALIGEEFDTEVRLAGVGTWGGHSTCCHDEDVDDRLREISAGDEWIALLPDRAREAL